MPMSIREFDEYLKKVHSIVCSYSTKSGTEVDVSVSGDGVFVVKRGRVTMYAGRDKEEATNAFNKAGTQ